MKLAKYIGQLIYDLQQVKAPQQVLRALEMESADEHERLLFRPNLEGPEDAIWRNLGEWLDLERIQFPPAEQLETPLLARLIDAMIGAISRLNISFVFPHDLPLTRRYALLLAHWDEQVPYSATGQWSIDFCAGWYEACALGDYCTCRKEFGVSLGEEVEAADPADLDAEVAAALAPFFDLPTETENDQQHWLAPEEEEELRYLQRLRSEFDDEFGEEE